MSLHELNPDLREILDDYLNQVERELMHAGKNRTERRRICDDLEGQIMEMFVERTSAEPTEADLRALLAELDKPEAYGETEGAQEIKHPPGAQASKSATLNTQDSMHPAPAPQSQHPIFRRLLKGIAITLISLIALFIVLHIVNLIFVAFALPNILKAIPDIFRGISQLNK